MLRACKWGEARDATKHPTMQRTYPTTRNLVAQNINNAKVEKPALQDSTDLEIIWIPTISKHST